MEAGTGGRPQDLLYPSMLNAAVRGWVASLLGDDASGKQGPYGDQGPSDMCSFTGNALNEESDSLQPRPLEPTAFPSC